VQPPLALVTGFGPFPGRALNPSREVARRLAADPPPGLRVRARELPVTFLGAPAAVRAAVASLEPERPAVLLGLGVQPQPCFRVERRARGRYDTQRLDNDGRSAAELLPDLGPDRENPLPLEPLVEALRAAGAPDVRLSDDAGGYVCEITYHALLGEGARLGARTLFLHLPPVEVLSTDAQTPLARALLAALAVA
jgi:pyroglutamyl-peptidase